MLVVPHICSERGLSMMHIFRYLFLYCLILMICKYFIHHFYVIFVFCNVFRLLTTFSHLIVIQL